MSSLGKFDYINKLLKNKTKVKPKAKQIYAVGTGTFVGEMLIYCKQDGENYYFLSIPKNINRVIPKDKFDLGIENKIIEFVKELPNSVYKICYKQHEHNEKNGISQNNQLK
jgi:hypothetical protein